MACSSCASKVASRLRRSRSSCSRNAIVTAPVVVSPVILANSSASRQVSASLIFRLNSCLQERHGNNILVETIVGARHSKIGGTATQTVPLGAKD